MISQDVWLEREEKVLATCPGRAPASTVMIGQTKFIPRRHHDVPHFILAVTERGNVWSETSVAAHKTGAFRGGGIIPVLQNQKPPGHGRAWHSQNRNHLVPSHVNT